MRKARRYRRNAITSDDMLHLAFAGVTGIALGFIMARKSQTAATAGLGAYYQDPVNLPISGLGNYVRVR